MITGTQAFRHYRSTLKYAATNYMIGSSIDLREFDLPIVDTVLQFGTWTLSANIRESYTDIVNVTTYIHITNIFVEI